MSSLLTGGLPAKVIQDAKLPALSNLAHQAITQFQSFDWSIYFKPLLALFFFVWIWVWGIDGMIDIPDYNEVFLDVPRESPSLIDYVENGMKGLRLLLSMFALVSLYKIKCRSTQRRCLKSLAPLMQLAARSKHKPNDPSIQGDALASYCQVMMDNPVALSPRLPDLPRALLGLTSDTKFPFDIKLMQTGRYSWTLDDRLRYLKSAPITFNIAPSGIAGVTGAKFASAAALPLDIVHFGLKISLSRRTIFNGYSVVNLPHSSRWSLLIRDTYLPSPDDFLLIVLKDSWQWRIIDHRCSSDGARERLALIQSDLLQIELAIKQVAAERSRTHHSLVLAGYGWAGSLMALIARCLAHSANSHSATSSNDPRSLVRVVTAAAPPMLPSHHLLWSSSLPDPSKMMSSPLLKEAFVRWDGLRRALPPHAHLNLILPTAAHCEDYCSDNGEGIGEMDAFLLMEWPSITLRSPRKQFAGAVAASHYSQSSKRYTSPFVINIFSFNFSFCLFFLTFSSM